MKFINKNKFHQEELAINVDFLQHCFDVDKKTFYPRVSASRESFDDFKKKDYRGGKPGYVGWEDLLLKEQDCRCCYCMRRLKQYSGKINYEHVIPRSLRGAEGKKEFSLYTEKSQILRDYVMMSDEYEKLSFNSKEDIALTEKMPHITSLANLLAACNGIINKKNYYGCCCNHNRGDDRITPIMLMPEADTRVKYDINGIIFMTGEKDDTLQKILRELNNETFQEVRSIWCRLSSVDVDFSRIEQYNLKDRIQLFEQAYQQKIASIPDNIRKYAAVVEKNLFYWDLLKDYDWFYGYYRKSNMEND